ncbi:hypothetical protein FOMG_19805 [Fusarium oxysporum f. sp. melonis 26406]|uniref:Uncharacterized protein n=1 Tax=Fusarium oxysporum f. sp. melonis 26406 TaxID=1089452 RepID=W9YV12_FUSOX|nr:hypothetical protein FOMG_19805 [Fusarium oxysporum f. sp. melonis 26406]
MSVPPWLNLNRFSVPNYHLFYRPSASLPQQVFVVMHHPAKKPIVATSAKRTGRPDSPPSAPSQSFFSWRSPASCSAGYPMTSP